jgi:maltose alpha-D-glucosyltransferase / alpha-amylase
MTPDALWYKDAVIYQLHVRTFCDGNGDGIGDFVGLIQKLDYLQSLGVTALWLQPFYESPLKDDGYDIAHYERIDPRFGRMDDFKIFLAEAHRRGLQVFTELVINHTSDQHPWFRASRKAPPGSPKRDFYVWSDTDQRYPDARIIFSDVQLSNWTRDPVAGAFYWHRFFHHQPDLNFDNPRVQRAVLKVMRFWLDLGVDGLRLDTVPHLFEREGTSCENLPETHAFLKKIRAELDRLYPKHALLAEIDEGPEQVRPYFGDGDECHMAFHFNLMKRLFVAFKREDASPVIDVIRQADFVPVTCQWAVFLRNHDELSIWNFTPEEREFMFDAYAPEPRMRLNVGIRRRLAPLLDNDRARIELATSLLFSFPGTPVMYYGDEIGMGDNVALKDREGVRTPMQWSAARHGGFSTTDGALTVPVIDTPTYGFRHVNVEAQEAHETSLLAHVKRLIQVRRAHPAFARGAIEFVETGNSHILAFLRRYRGESLLVTANLAATRQSCELRLSSEFTGSPVTDLIRGGKSSGVGIGPYVMTLGPHAFQWMNLGPAKVPGQVEAPSNTSVVSAHS